MLEKTLERPMECKEIQPIHSKGDQSWVFIGRTDAEAETPIFWPPHAKCWLIGQDPDAGKDWKQEKGMTEDEMVGWHHWLDGHEFEQAPGVGDGQGGLGCCRPWGCKESDTTKRLNWTDPWKCKKCILTKIFNRIQGLFILSVLPRGQTHRRKDLSPKHPSIFYLFSLFQTPLPQGLLTVSLFFFFPLTPPSLVFWLWRLSPFQQTTQNHLTVGYTRLSWSPQARLNFNILGNMSNGNNLKRKCYQV